MADGVFNIAKGRVGEYYARVEGNDPSDSSIVLVLGLGAITDATLKDLDTLAAIEANAGFSESTDAAYARKVLTDTELSAVPSPDDTNDRYEFDLPDQTWTGGMTGESLTRLIVCYRPASGSADSAIVPLTYHDYVKTTNGTDVIVQFDASGFFRAAE